MVTCTNRPGLLSCDPNGGNECAHSLPCRTFRLQDNKDVRELGENAFGGAAFKAVHLRNTAVRSVQGSALLPSRHRLSRLAVEDSGSLEEFPFHVLPELHRLDVLSLLGVSLASVPALKSPSLRRLSLARSGIQRLDDDGWATPNLRFLNISECSLLSAIAIMFLSMVSLCLWSHCLHSLISLLRKNESKESKDFAESKE